ncbi:O-antigen ligase family protein [Kytococcus sedentarius]|uniref:O-antigen ligase family protein n=1 Tax=Kytococcus sedentarius TaxID=1276 RepID=UPI0035BC89B7
MDAPARHRVATVLRAVGVVVLLAVLPLVSTPETLDVREPIRRVTIAAVLLCAAGTWWAGRRGPQLPRAVWWAMGVVALAAVASTWASANSWLSVVGRSPRDEGLLMIGAYLAMLPAGAVLFATAAGRRLAVWTATLSGWVLVWMGVRDVLSGQTHRVTTALGNASTVGIWGLLLAAWLGWVAWRERSWVALAGALAGGALLVLGASRGALSGVFVAAVLSMVLVARTEGARRVLLPAAVMVAGVVVVLALPMTRDRIFLEEAGAGTNITVRLMMWRHTLALVRQEPLLGLGPSRWVGETSAGYGPAWQAEANPGVRLDGVHNVVLQVTAALGVLGLLAVTGLAVVVGWSLWQVAMGRAGRAFRGAGPAGRKRVAQGRDAVASWPSAALALGVGTAVALMFAYTEPVFVVPGAAVVGGGLALAHGATDRGRDAHRIATGGVRELLPGALTLAALAALVATTMVWDGYRDARQAVSGGPATAGARLHQAERTAPWDPNIPVRAAGAMTTLAAGKGDWHHSWGNEHAPQDAVLTRACPRIAPDQQCLAWQARAAVQAGDPARGGLLAQQAVSMGPDDHLSRTVQQEVLLAQGRPTDAVAAARGHVERNPGLYTAWRMLARAQRASGDLASAQVSQARADQLQWELLER